MSPHGMPIDVVVSFDFDAEEVWIGEDPANADKPGTLSQGTYGAKVAVPLLLDLMHRLDLPATFFVPGRVAERYPHRVEEILAGGHEIGHHGYTHTSPARFTRDEEERESSEAATSSRLSAQRSWAIAHRPGSSAPATLDLLVAHGFTYSSNLMDDIRPYAHPGRDLVELPVHWTFDDAPHFWFDLRSWNKTVRTSAEVRALWAEELEGMRRVGGLVMLTMHPQIIGRPGRLAMLEDFLAWARSLAGVRFSTARAVAEAARRGTL